MSLLQQIEPLVSRASGSVASTTFGRNQFGPWTRIRGIPTDPNTALQQVVRDAMATLTARWTDILTSAQRYSWDLYARSVRRPGRLGRSNDVAGLPMYVRSNVPRIQANEASLPIVDQAPSLQTLTPYTLPAPTVLNVVDDTIHPFFAAADAWANETGAAMLFYASPPQSLDVHFYKGPYRFAGAILGDTGTPPPSPGTLPIPFPAVIGQRVFVRGRVTRADARLSPSFRLPADTGTQAAPLPILAEAFPGFPGVFTVTFDQLLKNQTHDNLNWFIRWNNLVWAVDNVFTLPGLNDLLAILSHSVSPLIIADTVTYFPPPFDVHGGLNGVPVLLFFGFPIT